MKHLLITIGIASLCLTGYSQNSHQKSFDDYQNDIKEFFSEFEKQNREVYDEFRKKTNEDYIEFIKATWKEFKAERTKEQPKEKPVPPVVIPKEELEKPIKSKPIVFDDKIIIRPLPIKPQPQPVNPIFYTPIENANHVKFSLFGTTLKVHYLSDKMIRLKNVENKEIVRGLKCLMNDRTIDNLILDCLNIRKERGFSDWAYLLMLRNLTEAVYGQDSNEAVLLMGYIYMQSGYRMRYAENDSKLYLLFASDSYIYNRNAYYIDNTYYYGLEELPSSLHICEASYPKEQNLSMTINKQQKFDNNPTEERNIISTRYPQMKVKCNTNKNLLDFYSAYPISHYNQNFMTKWATYANTPIQEELRKSLYPQIQEIIKGKSQKEATEYLLNWVQTGFTYGYDDELWGYDRAFFSEETLYYPCCDCEDRSILFTRLVRDLIHLKCILIYYPGHLACAVNFKENVPGDYIELNGNRFVVTDPTYIGAPIGKTMPDMDNSKAKVILLD